MRHDSIIIKAPAGTKARWVRKSQAASKKLGNWIAEQVEANMIKQALQKAQSALSWYQEQDQEIAGLVEKRDHAAIRVYYQEYIRADAQENGDGPDHEEYAARVAAAFEELADAIEANDR